MVKEITPNKNEQMNTFENPQEDSPKRTEIELKHSEIQKILSISGLTALSKIKGEALKVLILLKQEDLFNRRKVAHEAIELALLKLEKFYRELSELVKEAEQKTEAGAEVVLTELHALVIWNIGLNLETLKLNFKALTNPAPQEVSGILETLVAQIEQVKKLFN